MAETDFWEKFFSGRKCRKYAGNRRFCRFSSDFFIIIRSFHTKTLIIRMPIIEHGSIVNKTDFCSWNSLKIAGTAYFRRNYFMNFSSCTLYFFMKFGTLMRNGNTLNVTEPDFRKAYFSGRKCRKCISCCLLKYKRSSCSVTIRTFECFIMDFSNVLLFMRGSTFNWNIWKAKIVARN